MKIVVFRLTISASWGNGHATLWRGLCRALEHRGIAPHHTSAPQVKEQFAEFCAAMIRRYCGSAAPAAGIPAAAE